MTVLCHHLYLNPQNLTTDPVATASVKLKHLLGLVDYLLADLSACMDIQLDQ